jgi:hypothetical protein
VTTFDLTTPAPRVLGICRETWSVYLIA